jgi:glycosyltransferase involved in cell wall biosynthesis
MQSYPNIEHILVDGGSTDNTMHVVREHGGHLSLVVSERDRGIYDAMNKGLSFASGDIVGFLNSDDVFYDKSSIQDIVTSFNAIPTDAVYGDLVFVDPFDTRKIIRFWKSNLYMPGDCARGWMPPHPTFYVRTSVLRQMGGFCLDYRLQADFELMLRLFHIRNIRSIYLPQVLVRMRTGGATTGSWKNIISGNLEASRACRANGLHGGALFIMRKWKHRIPQLLFRKRHIRAMER